MFSRTHKILEETLGRDIFILFHNDVSLTLNLFPGWVILFWAFFHITIPPAYLIQFKSVFKTKWYAHSVSWWKCWEESTFWFHTCRCKWLPYIAVCWRLSLSLFLSVSASCSVSVFVSVFFFPLPLSHSVSFSGDCAQLHESMKDYEGLEIKQNQCNSHLLVGRDSLHLLVDLYRTTTGASWPPWKDLGLEWSGMHYKYHQISKHISNIPSGKLT